MPGPADELAPASLQPEVSSDAVELIVQLKLSQQRELEAREQVPTPIGALSCDLPSRAQTAALVCGLG